MLLLWRPSASADTFELLRRLYYLSMLSEIIMLHSVSDFAVMFTEIRVHVPCCVSSSRMFKDALRSEVALELATAREKIMAIQRDIDTCK